MILLKIAATVYSTATKQFEIYISGCDGYCDKVNEKYLSDPKARCHNPELWDFNYGDEWEKCLPTIFQKVEKYKSIIKSIGIYGGEPLLQNHNALDSFLTELSSLNIPIWLFTRFKIENVPDFIKSKCTFIKCGEFNYSLKTDNNIQYGIKLASSNQKIYCFTEDDTNGT